MPKQQHTSGFLQNLPAPILVIPRSRTEADYRYVVQSESDPGHWIVRCSTDDRELAIRKAAQYRDEDHYPVRVVDNTL